MKTSEIGKAIWEGACNDDSKAVVQEIAELGLDSTLSDGLLKDIPFFSTIVAACKTASSIRNMLFLRKVALFFANTSNFTEAEKERFFREMRDDPEKTQQLSDTLVLILEKLDDFEKPALLAKAFAGLVRGKISLETFRRLVSAIDIGFIADLRALQESPRQTHKITAEHYSNLLRTGLSTITQDPNRDAVFEGSYVYQMEVNTLGRIFIGCMNEDYDFAKHYPKVGF